MRKQLHGIWVTELKSPDGAVCVIADHGAHLLSWTTAAGESGFYLSDYSQYGGSSAIRGGVPIIFPQFSTRGAGKRHGFARIQKWRQDFAGVEQGHAVARYSLHSRDVSGVEWPHQFGLLFEVVFSGEELRMSLTVHNPSDRPWEFSAAFHTYLHVSDISDVQIGGLENVAYIDYVRDRAEAIQNVEALHIEGETDRIYLAVEEPVVVTDGTRVINVQKKGFSDVVVWNPGQKIAGQIVDMVLNDYRSFVCVEAGAIVKPVTLQPGDSWIGTQSLAIRGR